MPGRASQTCIRYRRWALNGDQSSAAHTDHDRVGVAGLFPIAAKKTMLAIGYRRELYEGGKTLLVFPLIRFNRYR